MQFKCIVFLTYLISISAAYAQVDVWKSYEQVKLEVQLLKGDALPIDNLNQKIAYLAIDMQAADLMQEYLHRYTSVERLNLSDLQSEMIMGRDIAPLLKEKCDLLIIGVQTAGYKQNRGGLSFSINLLESVLKNYHPLPEIAFLSFGPSAFHQAEIVQNADLLIHSDTMTALHMDLAVQKLFAGLEGKRLGFACPEAVAMQSEMLQQIDLIVEEGIQARAFPGAQILVAKAGQVVYQKAFGHHTYDKKRRVKLSDVYDLASITKISGPLPLLMQLYDQGKIDLDEALRTYWPAFKRAEIGQLSVRSILAHQGGLQAWIPFWKSMYRKNGKFKRRTIKAEKSKRYPTKIRDKMYLHRRYFKKIDKAIRSASVDKDPSYRYSGLSFYLWPRIIEGLSKDSYEAQLRVLYDELGAQRLGFKPLERYDLDKIVPTERDSFFRHELIHGTVHDEGAIMMAGVNGNAGLFSNALDLAKLLQLYLNEGSYGSKQYFVPEVIQEFTRYQYPDKDNRRGLGFDKPLLEYNEQKSSVSRFASQASYGHSGYTGTLVWVDPEHDLIYVFLSNRVHPSRKHRKIYELNIRPRIHEVIYQSFLRR